MRAGREEGAERKRDGEDTGRGREEEEEKREIERERAVFLLEQRDDRWMSKCHGDGEVPLFVVLSLLVFSRLFFLWSLFTPGLSYRPVSSRPRRLFLLPPPPQAAYSDKGSTKTCVNI